LNALTQLTLKCSLPGVPDFYQGTELWDFSMVDPDTRRAVDFDERRKVLAAEPRDPSWPDLVDLWHDGHVKLRWTQHLLAYRQAMPDLFTHGDFRMLPVRGAQQDHIIAYARRRGAQAVVVVACRKFARLTDGGRRWPDLQQVDAHVDLDGLTLDHDGTAAGIVPVSALLGVLPVAVLPAKVT
jgi:(1->4)-alpha-D-glucan 1-alpha-D-glucosylmutase